MRTTLDLNDTVMRRIRRKAMDEQKSLKEVINQALAQSVSTESTPSTKRRPYRCPTFRMGESRVTLDKALSLSNQLEDEAILSKLEMRK